MSSPRVARAAELAAQLRSAGIEATHDAAAVAGLAPCVLVGPPRLVFDVGDSATASWRLLAIAATPSQMDAWTQLDGLVDAVAGLLPVESADPTSWAVAPGADALPAYALTLTD